MSYHFIELLLTLTQKEIKARYKHAVLGFLWIFINPLIQMAIMGFVFSLIFRFGIKNYYLFLFVGLLPWNFLSLALNKATSGVVWDRNLIQKSKFPREVIPLSIVFSHFFHFLASWLMLIVFLVITRQFQFITLSALGHQLIAITLLLILTSGLSFFTSALTVFYRDVAFITKTGIMLWFYTTPIIYPLSIIPQRFLKVFYLNPLLTIFAWLQKPLVNNDLPSVVMISHSLIILLICLLGWLYFRKKSRYFSDWL